MSIVVQSRFACLKVEDDDIKPTPNNNEKKKIVTKVIKKQNKKKDETSSSSKKNNTKQTTQMKREKPKKKVTTEKQWEEWQQKDTEFMNGCFEEELRNAILVSKLEYEEEVKQQVKNNHIEKKNDKKKKNKPISLEEFLASSTNTNSSTTNIEKPNENNFFENVQIEINEEIEKDKLIQRRKEREINIEEVITIAHYQEKLEKEKQRNVVLQKELDVLKVEMIDVKSRNKTLCGILGHGEMKDKADVLLELETLQTVRNELTEEVTKLHALLEQERSKVASLQLELQQHSKHKEKKNKKSMPNSKN